VPTGQISLRPASLKTYGAEKPLRSNFDLRSDSKLIWVVQSLSKKYSAGAVGQITAISSRHLIPEEGADRDRHERGMGRGGRGSVGRGWLVRRAVFRE
jgi:hypothetical protein